MAPRKPKHTNLRGDDDGHTEGAQPTITPPETGTTPAGGVPGNEPGPGNVTPGFVGTDACVDQSGQVSAEGAATLPEGT